MYEIWLLQLVDLQAFPTSKYIFLNIAQIAGQANSESKERFVVTSNMQCLYIYMNLEICYFVYTKEKTMIQSRLIPMPRTQSKWLGMGLTIVHTSVLSDEVLA